MPKTRIQFWKKKFEANVKRDQEVQKELYNQGIKCLIIWECTIKKMKNKADCEKYLNIVRIFLEENTLHLEI